MNEVLKSDVRILPNPLKWVIVIDLTALAIIGIRSFFVGDPFESELIYAFLGFREESILIPVLIVFATILIFAFVTTFYRFLRSRNWSVLRTFIFSLVFLLVIFAILGFGIFILAVMINLT